VAAIERFGSTSPPRQRGVRGTFTTSSRRRGMHIALSRRSYLAQMERTGVGQGLAQQMRCIRHMPRLRASRRKARGKATTTKPDQTPHRPSSPAPRAAPTQTLRPRTPLLLPPGNATWSEGPTARKFDHLTPHTPLTPLTLFSLGFRSTRNVAVGSSATTQTQVISRRDVDADTTTPVNIRNQNQSEPQSQRPLQHIVV
jgi:hypothetical protein